MRFIAKVLVTAAALWIAVGLVPGLSFDGSITSFLIVSALVVVANAVVRPILNFFSFPLILLTMGLFLLVTNALVLQLVIWMSAPDRLDLGLSSTGFFWATFFGAVVVSLVRIVLERVLDRLD
ncbi:MAG: phage holin family protein [Acidimicrobiia bacterium]